MTKFGWADALKSEETTRRGFLAPGSSVLLPIVITLLAGGLRFYKLGSKSLWLDEIITAEVSIKGLGNIIRFSITDTGPLPLAYLFEYFSQLFGRSEFLVRLPSVLFGIGAIPLVYMLGHRLFHSTRAGAAAAVLLTFSAFHHYYSQEARGYALYALLAVLSVLLLQSALEKRRWKSWIIYGVCCALLVYTTYFGVFIILANLIYGLLLILRESRSGNGGQTAKSRVLGLLLVTLVVGLMLLPWVVLNYPVHQAYGAGRSPYSLTQMAHYLYATLLQFSNGAKSLLIGMVGVATIGAVLHREARQKLFYVYVILVFLLPLAVIYLTQAGHFLSPRYLIAALPFTLLLAAAGLERIGELIARIPGRAVPLRLAHHFGLGIVCGLCLVYLLPGIAKMHQTIGREKQNWKAACRYVTEHVRPDDLIIGGINLGPLCVYHYIDPALRPSVVFGAYSIDEVNSLLKTGQRTWYLTAYYDSDQGVQLHQWIGEHFTEQAMYPGTASNVYVFLKSIPSQ